MRIKRNNREFWLTLADDAQVLVCPLTNSETNALIKKHTHRKYERHQPTEKFNSNEFSKEMFSLVVQDWKEMEWEDGTPIPCDDAGKAEVYDLANDVAGEILREMEEQQKKERIYLEKN